MFSPIHAGNPYRPFVQCIRYIIRTIQASVSGYIRDLNMKDFIVSRAYRKPESVCRFSPQWEAIVEPEEVAAFIASAKREVENTASGLGYRVRLAGLKDLDSVTEFHSRLFPKGVATLESPYVLFRIIRYGYAAILEDDRGRILGVNVCQGYDDPDRTAYGVRISVDPSVSGQNFGAMLVRYTCLLGMERGARLRRGLLSPTNYGSAANFLNYNGYLCDEFMPDLPTFGARFTVCMPLTPGALMNSRIDLEKVRAFVDSREPGVDYRLVDCEDIEGHRRHVRGKRLQDRRLYQGGIGLLQGIPAFCPPQESLGHPLIDRSPAPDPSRSRNRAPLFVKVRSFSRSTARFL